MKPKEKISIWKTYKEYNALTTVHGSKYITEPGSHQSERLCWTLVMVLALGLSIHLVSLIMINWIENPVLTSIDNTDFPASSIHFPAVTVCPVFKALPTKIISEVCRRRMDEEVLKTDFTIQMVLDRVVSRVISTRKLVTSSDKEELDAQQLNITLLDILIERNLNLSVTKIATFIRKVSPNCKDYILHCEWLGLGRDCSSLFQLQATDDGYCCTFNAVPSKERLTDVGTADSFDIDINFDNDDLPDYDYINPLASIKHVREDCETRLMSLEVINNRSSQVCNLYREKAKKQNITVPDGSSKNHTAPNSTQIHGVNGPGIANGLRFLVDMLPCADFPTATFNGLRVLIHHPKDFPLIRNRGIAIGEGTETFMTVHANKIVTTEALRKYGNVKRGCYFPDEKNLRFFASYRQSACEIEKFLEISQENCSCRPYYLPGNSRICTNEDFKCVSEVVRTMFFNVSCLPSCLSTAYDITVSHVPFPLNGLNISSSFPGVTLKQDARYSVINVFFDSSTIVKYKRDELYTVVSIISNIGGSLGLCMGFSLVSAIEFFYHFTLRYFLKKSGQRD